MQDKLFRLLYFILLLVLCSAKLAVAQENTSPFQRISVDFSYGLPFYQGDFYSFFSTPAPYQDQPLKGMAISNNSILQGSVTIPWKKWLGFRLKATQATLFFSEANAQVFFKNSLYDFTGAVQFSFSYKYFQTYLYLGGGYHTSSDATVFQTLEDLNTGNNDDQVQRISSTAGFGIEYIFWKQFALFAEFDYYFSGSDRFDGYNGFAAGMPELEKEKTYLDRDRLLSGRGGLRVYFTGKAKNVAERSFDKPSSAYYDNPYLPEDHKVEQEGLSEELKRLGVKKNLQGYTVLVNHVMNIEELKRQKEAGDRVISYIQAKIPAATLELLLENKGFTIHIGGFASQGQAKNALYIIRQYYSNGLVVRH